jgi:hypothetical protein
MMKMMMMMMVVMVMIGGGSVVSGQPVHLRIALGKTSSSMSVAYDTYSNPSDDCSRDAVRFSLSIYNKNRVRCLSILNSNITNNSYTDGDVQSRVFE